MVDFVVMQRADWGLVESAVGNSDKLDTLFCFSSTLYTQETRCIEVLLDTKDVKDFISKLTLQPQGLYNYIQLILSYKLTLL